MQIIQPSQAKYSFEEAQRFSFLFFIKEDMGMSAFLIHLFEEMNALFCHPINVLYNPFSR
jgi:hypothetical protein